MRMVQNQTALLLTEVGKPLTKSTIPIDAVPEGRVLVKVSATGLMPCDWKVRDTGALGVAENLPAVLGSGAAGRVMSSSSSSSSSSNGTRELPIGTRIVFMPVLHPYLIGGLKEYATADPRYVLRVPQHVTDEEAATLAGNPFTAAIALFDPVFGFGIPLPSTAKSGFDYAGTKLVVIGGTSLARFAVQQARLVGVGTIVVVASPASLPEFTAYGATHVVSRQLDASEIEARVREVVGDDLRFVFDTYNAGDSPLARSFFHHPGGILVMASSYGPRDQPALTAKGIVVKGFKAFFDMHPELAAAWVPVFERWLEAGEIKIPPFKAFPLEADAVNRALDEVKEAGTGVKYVVRVATEV